jgi:hypothetical protein
VSAHVYDPYGRLLINRAGANVASASTITVPLDGDYHVLTGATTVNYISTSGYRSGSVIELRVPSGLRLANGLGGVPAGTANLDLAGNADLYSESGITYVRLRYDGSSWREMSRREPIPDRSDFSAFHQNRACQLLNVDPALYRWRWDDFDTCGGNANDPAGWTFVTASSGVRTLLDAGFSRGVARHTTAAGASSVSSHFGNAALVPNHSTGKWYNVWRVQLGAMGADESASWGMIDIAGTNGFSLMYRGATSTTKWQLTHDGSPVSGAGTLTELGNYAADTWTVVEMYGKGDGKIYVALDYGGLIASPTIVTPATDLQLVWDLRNGAGTTARNQYADFVGVLY